MTAVEALPCNCLLVLEALVLFPPLVAAVLRGVERGVDSNSDADGPRCVLILLLKRDL